MTLLLIGVLCIIAVSSLSAAPARVSAKPVDENIVKVYAYRVEPLVTLDDERPGFLVELTEMIVVHPEMDVAVEVSPVAVLMKYSLIQSVGVSAIGTEKDFSGAELKDLRGIPLYVMGGKEYKLFFNSLNPLADQLFDGTVAMLEKIREEGSYDQLKAKYGLQ